MARRYYKLDDSQSGSMIEMAENFINRYFEVEDNRAEFMSEHGISSFLGDGMGGVKAAKFYERPSIGWKESAIEKDCFVPDVETEEGRAINSKLHKLNHPAPVDIWRKLDVAPAICAGRISMPGVERFNGRIIISIPKTKFNLQPGMREISRDEYLSMREEAIQSEVSAHARNSGMRNC